MLSLRPIGKNQTEIVTDLYKILFSYSTPVAYMNRNSHYIYVTTEKYSNTTTRHIKKWLEGRKRIPIVQHLINNLLERI